MGGVLRAAAGTVKLKRKHRTIWRDLENDYVFS